MTDDTTPATKADIQALMDSIGRLYDANEHWKDEVILSFSISVEHFRQELIGIHKDTIRLLEDRTKSHDGRILRLETRLGV